MLQLPPAVYETSDQLVGLVFNKGKVRFHGFEEGLRDGMMAQFLELYARKLEFSQRHVFRTFQKTQPALPDEWWEPSMMRLPDTRGFRSPENAWAVSCCLYSIHKDPAASDSTRDLAITLLQRTWRTTPWWKAVKFECVWKLGRVTFGPHRLDVDHSTWQRGIMDSVMASMLHIPGAITVLDMKDLAHMLTEWMTTEWKKDQLLRHVLPIVCHRVRQWCDTVQQQLQHHPRQSATFLESVDGHAEEEQKAREAREAREEDRKTLEATRERHEQEPDTGEDPFHHPLAFQRYMERWVCWALRRMWQHCNFFTAVSEATVDWDMDDDVSLYVQAYMPLLKLMCNRATTVRGCRSLLRLLFGGLHPYNLPYNWKADHIFHNLGIFLYCSLNTVTLWRAAMHPHMHDVAPVLLPLLCEVSRTTMCGAVARAIGMSPDHVSRRRELEQRLSLGDLLLRQLQHVALEGDAHASDIADDMTVGPGLTELLLASVPLRWSFRFELPALWEDRPWELEAPDQQSIETLCRAFSLPVMYKHWRERIAHQRQQQHANRLVRLLQAQGDLDMPRTGPWDFVAAFMRPDQADGYFPFHTCAQNLQKWTTYHEEDLAFLVPGTWGDMVYMLQQCGNILSTSYRHSSQDRRMKRAAKEAIRDCIVGIMVQVLHGMDCSLSTALTLFSWALMTQCERDIDKAPLLRFWKLVLDACARDVYQHVFGNIVSEMRSNDSDNVNDGQHSELRGVAERALQTLQTFDAIDASHALSILQDAHPIQAYTCDLALRPAPPGASTDLQALWPSDVQLRALDLKDFLRLHWARHASLLRPILGHTMLQRTKLMPEGETQPQRLMDVLRNTDLVRSPTWSEIFRSDVSDSDSVVTTDSGTRDELGDEDDNEDDDNDNDNESANSSDAAFRHAMGLLTEVPHPEVLAKMHVKNIAEAGSKSARSESDSMCAIAPISDTDLQACDPAIRELAACFYDPVSAIAFPSKPVFACLQHTTGFQPSSSSSTPSSTTTPPAATPSWRPAADIYHMDTLLKWISAQRASSTAPPPNPAGDGVLQYTAQAWPFQQPEWLVRVQRAAQTIVQQAVQATKKRQVLDTKAPRKRQRVGVPHPHAPAE